MAATLVTGASGLIGAHFMRAFEGDTIVAIPHSEADLLAEGVMAELVAHHRPVTVVHLAWCASGSPGYRTSGDNALWLDRSVDLLAACRRFGAHLVLTGTVSDDGSGTDAYSRSKAELRGIAREAAAHQSLSFVRPHYVFDPDRGRPQLIADALAAARAEVPVELADPYARHDFIHAADVANALLLVIRHRLLGEVDIGSGNLHEVREVVSAAGVSWVSRNPEATNPRTSPAADIARLVDQGWRPQQTVQFFGRPRKET